MFKDIFIYFIYSFMLQINNQVLQTEVNHFQPSDLYAKNFLNELFNKMYESDFKEEPLSPSTSDMYTSVVSRHFCVFSFMSFFFYVNLNFVLSTCVFKILLFEMGIIFLNTVIYLFLCIILTCLLPTTG